MKFITPPLTRFIRPVAAAAALLLTGSLALAHPYASGITGTNGAGKVSFVMNEDGATVNIVFDDNTTNSMGVLPKGMTNFTLAPHTSFRIICFKTGNGLPSIISSDAVGVYTYSNSVWNAPGGVAVNQNPKIGSLFGRTYANNNVAGAQSSGPKSVGIYAMNADQTFVSFRANPTSGTFVGSINANFKSPGRMRVAPDNTLLVADSQGVNNQNQIYLFQPDLSSSSVLLGPSPATGAGDQFGTPVVFGSLAAGNLVLYTASAGTPSPSDTNCIQGPLTGPGSFNNIYKYNIGSGPLPWNKRPDYAYTVGLDGIAQLRPEVDVTSDGKVYAGFGRANFSNPDIQILRPVLTTNGITGDPVNKDIQDAAKSSTNWLYTSGVNPPFNIPPAFDPWNGVNGSGSAVGMYAGVRVSPDGKYFASVDINNGVTIASLTNGIPNDGTIFSINPANFAYTVPAGIGPAGFGAVVGNGRGMDWDAANNLWVISSGQALLRCYSLGLTTTCISSNDWTGTNGTFQLVVPPLQSSVAIVNGTASQNYTNNITNPGNPIPGVFRISLNTADTTASGSVTVNFVRSGTANIIGAINVVNGGSNFLTAPTVAITGGNGSGAAAFATLTGDKVTSVTVTSPGTGYTAAPTVTFTGGSGSNVTVSVIRGLDLGQYTVNTNETPNGVTVGNNSVTFPAGVFAGSNGPNWNVDVKIIPKIYPVSGPTYTFNVRLLGGTNYAAAAPLSGAITMLNTGPQLLQLTAASPATLGGMNRGIPRDSARFVITRLGDTNGPGNDSLGVVAKSYTVTNINYYGTAQYTVDYTARAQNFDGGLPNDGSPGIVIPPGVATVNAMIGNPVKHTDTSIKATNLTVIINLTNICDTVGSPGCNTTAVSSENYPYTISTAQLTLNEFDNAVGGEVVLWSNPLTNSLDSTNWTLVYAAASLQDTNGNVGSPTLPRVLTNYDNSANLNGGNYLAVFGKSVNDPANDAGVTVPQSDVMAANGWTTALKVSVNKNTANSTEAGVNLYPQIPGAPWDPTNYMKFNGNYALRFEMFLALYDFGLNNPAIGTPAREFAAFGINHRGTNANWRLDINPRADGTGARPINADGEWCSIGAASGSITPADYDMFISPAFALFDNNGAPLPQPIPYTTNFATFAPLTNAYQSPPGNYLGITNVFGNNGVPNDQQSQNNNSFGGAPQNGVIKNPPFQGINNLGGAPDNAWVGVSLEVSRQTNLSLLVARQQIFNSSTTNPAAGTVNILAPFSGTPMLGYLDPNRDVSDFTAFVYYSNVRVVELSPFIPWTNQPLGIVVTQGSSFTLNSGATFASLGLTNTWYLATTNGPNPIGRSDNGTPIGAIVTNSFPAVTNALDSLAVNNLQFGSNYLSVWSDQAGSVTSWVASVEVVIPPTNKTVLWGATSNVFTIPISGNAPPTWQWMRGGTNVVNGTRFTGATTGTLGITGATTLDSGVYSNRVASANGNGFVVLTATLTVLPPNPPTFTGFTNTGANIAMSYSSPNPFDTTNAYVLQSAGIVTGPYTNNGLAVFSGSNPFSVTAPKQGDQMFYRLVHVP